MLNKQVRPDTPTRALNLKDPFLALCLSDLVIETLSAHGGKLKEDQKPLLWLCSH